MGKFVVCLEARPDGPIRQKSETRVSKPVSKAVTGHRSEVPEWNRPKGLKGDDATLLEFFEKSLFVFQFFKVCKLEPVFYEVGSDLLNRL